jgi:hypothetical protein
MAGKRVSEGTALGLHGPRRVIARVDAYGVCVGPVHQTVGKKTKKGGKGCLRPPGSSEAEITLPLLIIIGARPSGTYARRIERPSGRACGSRHKTQSPNLHLPTL